MSQAPTTVAGQIESDGKEPGFEAPGRIEASARTEGSQERLLKQIFSFGDVAANAEQESIKRLSISLQKRPSCFVVASKHEPGQLFVGARIITHHIKLVN